MAIYRKCEYCGSALDPGEKCDCNEKEEKPNEIKLNKGFSEHNNDFIVSEKQ